MARLNNADNEQSCDAGDNGGNAEHAGRGNDEGE